MQPETASTIFIIVLFFIFVGIIALIVKDGRKNKAKEPEKEKNDPLQYYSSDLVIISDTLENTKGYWHLISLRDDIELFDKDYCQLQEPHKFESDKNQLIQRWRQKKLSYELEMFCLN